MNSKQRVAAVIAHTQPDKIPKTLWHQICDQSLVDKVIQKYGKLLNFYELLGLDIYSVYASTLNNLPDHLSIKQALNTRLPEPSMQGIVSSEQPHLDFLTIEQIVKVYGESKYIIGTLPGVFELAQYLMGTEGILLSMALYKNRLKSFFQYLADWLVKVAHIMVKCGVDALFLTDDWGENNKLLFNPQDWWELIYPADKKIVDAVKEEGLPVGLHSDGYIMDILPGVVRMGVDILHPVQTSAGMNIQKVKQKFGDKLCIMGGLDIEYILPRSSKKELTDTIRVMLESLKSEGGFIFCTEHTPQPDTEIERVKLACEIVDMYGKYEVNVKH